jgi:hypothetical protein
MAILRAEPIDNYQFRFTGGLADAGELNFYELSRSQYAAARLLYTLARYHETGRVVARLSEKSIADIRIRSPSSGSFIYDALVFVLAEGSKVAVSVPLKVLFTMVWDRILSTTSDFVNLKSEATLELRRIEQKTQVALSKEETKRLEILREVQHDKEVTKRELVGLARELYDEHSLRPDAPAKRLTGLKVIAEDLQLEIEREEIMKPHFDDLNKISSDDKRKLFGKSRPLIAEIGLPLRSSAEEFDVSVGRERRRIGWMDAERAAEIAETAPDEDLDQLVGQLIQYNVETGYGRFKIEEGTAANEYGKDISFRILKPMKNTMTDIILDAMKLDRVVGEFMVTRDKEGLPKQLVLINLTEVGERTD